MTSLIAPWLLLLLLLGTRPALAFYKLTSSSQQQQGSSETCFEVNTVYHSGHTLAEKLLSGPDTCQAWCQLHRECSHFSYYHKTKTCYLRRGNKAEPRAGITSGPRNCFDPPAPPPTNSRRLSCVGGDICLQGGSQPHEGDVLVDGQPVCDDNWGLREGAVVCREMGFPGVAEVTRASWFGVEAANYSMTEVVCNGNETSLKECYHTRQNFCAETEVAGVVCSTMLISLPSACYEAGAVCLQGGSFAGEGNVYYQGRPVCDHGWDLPDAAVVCRRLGYTSVANVSVSSRYGPGTTFFELSRLACDGDEVDLPECFHDDLAEGCDAGTVAGVTCSGLIERVEGHPAAVSGLIGGVVLLAVLLLGLAGLSLARERKRRNKLDPGENRENIYKFRNPINQNNVDFSTMAQDLNSTV